jgi:hypothetical protein
LFLNVLRLFAQTAGEDDSEEEEDDDLEAAQLEKMVAKLSRIVKHVIPNKSIELDENVDKNTSNWLSQVRTWLYWRSVWIGALVVVSALRDRDCACQRCSCQRVVSSSLFRLPRLF